MSSLVDFNISTPRNRTNSSNECGVVINNHVSNCIPRKDPPLSYGRKGKIKSRDLKDTTYSPQGFRADPKETHYPDLNDCEYKEREVKFDDLPPPSVVPEEDIQDIRSPIYTCNTCHVLEKDLSLYKEIALTFSKILKDNNKKLLANIVDQSNKIIIDNVSLCKIISIILDIPVDYVTLQYNVHTSGCFSKIVRFADIQDIKINHIDFRLGYNEKYNILLQDFNISLTKVMI
jgi:hypothetical protein